jgi:hypothetical protein
MLRPLPISIAASNREAGMGKASPWNTLRALRVLDWYGH